MTTTRINFFLASAAMLLATAAIALACVLYVKVGSQNAERVQKNQQVSCQTGDVVAAYLQTRSRQINAPGQKAALRVLQRGRPILDCGENRNPLSLKQQRIYADLLFECVCQPVVKDGRVVDRQPFRALPR